MRVARCGRKCSSPFQMFFSVLNVIFPSCYLQTRLAAGLCEAEQRTGGICWLRGELAGVTESLAADLMTKGGSKLRAQTVSVPRRGSTSRMAVCSSAAGVLERPRCGGRESPDVPGHVCASGASGFSSQPGSLPTWAPGACSACLNGYRGE